MATDDAIRLAKDRFDPYLHTPEYRRIHSDDGQLERLLGLFPAEGTGAYLDLGTGNGYVAFELARRHPGFRVVGLDIAEKAIKRDNELASESRRVTKKGGFFILSDPLTHERDAQGFVDRFKSLVPDGHRHFYGRKEIEAAFARYGYEVAEEFSSTVRYPRTMDARYEKLLAEAQAGLRDLYRIEIVDDQVFIEVGVMNVKFRRALNSGAISRIAPGGRRP